MPTLNQDEDSYDHSYSSLLTPRGKIIFKNRKEYHKKIPKNCGRPFIMHKYLDIEDEADLSNNKCKSTAIILTGFHNETINIYIHIYYQ